MSLRDFNALTVPVSACPRSCGSGRIWYITEMDALLSRITIDPAVCHGKPCVSRRNVAGLLSSGMTMDEILADYEDLEREDLLAVLAFAARLA